MNYYIQGNAAKADKIRAAFEMLGYKTIEYVHQLQQLLRLMGIEKEIKL